MPKAVKKKKDKTSEREILEKFLDFIDESPSFEDVLDMYLDTIKHGSNELVTEVRDKVIDRYLNAP